MEVALLAGSLSTALFIGSCLPMLVKAARTRDLDSYSRGHLVLATVGNVINCLYVFSLPVGPIWFLHLFNLGCTVLMLAWHLRYAGRTGTHVPPRHEAGASGRRSTPEPNNTAHEMWIVG